MAQPRHYSEHSAEAVDDAVRELLLKAEHQASDIIKQHRGKLDKLISLLEKEETLYREQVEECLEGT